MEGYPLLMADARYTQAQVKEIIRYAKERRDGVIGGALDTWMLYENFSMAIDNPKELGINLEKLVDHFDHICQLSGNSNHIGFGSDLDGLFGTEQTLVL